MFTTKIAVVLRNDLATWQALNVTAFLSGGLVGKEPDLMGEAYVDKAGNRFNPLIRQPIVILAGDAATLSKIHNRALGRGVDCSAYVEDMFKTGHDAANRAVFGEYGPADAPIVGLALHADGKVVDKITKGAKLHP